MANAPLRSEIETALNELESHEGGIRFQPLAVVLAKQRWPELVAAERKGDLGLDAFVTRAQATDGVGRGVACSITAAYGKIADDAKKVTKNFGNQIQHLMFATSGRVSTPKKIEWADQLREEFGLELVVVSREDIITSLTDPRNVALCRTYLGLDLVIEPSVGELIDKIRDAAREEVTNWARPVAAQPLIELHGIGVDSDGVDTDKVWSLADIAAALRDGHRLVLEAPAGRGKTTTLVQVARGPLGSSGAVFLIDLPSWVKSGRGILSFIAGVPAFQRRGLTSDRLMQTEAAERFYFLLNGWNEVTDSLTNDAGQMMRELERQFPSAGILVATRAHHVSPPLPGSSRIRLRRVGHRARSMYVRERLGERATELLTAIDSDGALNELTRTPFVLSAVVSVVAEGEPIPRNRIAVMRAAIRLQERSPEHEAQLQSAPLGGMSAAFLERLAIAMIRRGAVSLSDSEGRAVVHEVSGLLAADGQTVSRPAPGDILNALSAHHLLERLDYPAIAYRFDHQLFQEYYASRGLERRYQELARRDFDLEGRTEFVREYVNQPAWTEPLHMLAETLSTPENDTPNGRHRLAPTTLVEMTLTVDPLFASQLARVLGVASAEPIGRTLDRRLRENFSSSDDHHRNCAVAAMLASGLDAFRDIVEPLLSADDEQVRLRTYRLWSDINPSILGDDWRTVVSAWTDEARATFASEILHHRFVPEVSAFALADPSPGVKEAAIDALSWIGADDEYVRALVAEGDEVFFRVIAGQSSDMIPAALRPRALRLLRERLAQTSDTAQRMRTLVLLHKLGDGEAIANLKAGLEEIPGEEFHELRERTISPVLDVLRDADADWTSEWVAKRIADGRLWSDWWSKYLTVISEALREQQFVRLATQDLEHRHDGPIAIVARNADRDLARRAFLRVLEVWKVILAPPRQPHALEGAVLYQLEALLRAIPPATVVSAVSDFLTEAPNREFIEAFVHLYGRTAAMDMEVLDLDDPSRSLVRRYLKGSIALILEQDDFAGEVKAELGSVLSQVGEPADIEDLMRLVHADLKRVQAGRAARVRGERSEAANGAVMSWTRSHVRAIVGLLRENADDVLLRLFNEREYERDLLEEYARQFARPQRQELHRRPNYDRVWQARAQPMEPLQVAARRARVADAIRTRIQQLEETRATETDPKYLNYRVKMFALGLAGVAPRQYADEIMALLSLPADYDAGMCVDALERLLLAGASLPASKCLPLLDSSLERMKKWGMQDYERWTIVRFLCICPYVDPPEAGIGKIREILERTRLNAYYARDLLPALGSSRFDGALDLMRDLIRSVQEWHALQHEWISALVQLDTDNGRRTVLGLIDPDLPSLPFPLDWAVSDEAATAIAKLAAQDSAIDSRLRDLSLAPLDARRRELLAKTLAARGTPDAVFAMLNLLDDAARPRIPSAVDDALENAFVAREPHAEYPGAVVLRSSSSNRVRALLFAMVFNDDRRKHAAFSLLGQIEEWRLQYGRPIDEPRHPDLESRLPWPPPEPRMTD
jgi:hypothetical protein